MTTWRGVVLLIVLCFTDNSLTAGIESSLRGRIKQNRLVSQLSLSTLFRREWTLHTFLGALIFLT